MKEEIGASWRLLRLDFALHCEKRREIVAKAIALDQMLFPIL